jgi:hypothetical protein
LKKIILGRQYKRGHVMPVVVATWEAESGRIMIQGQPGQGVQQDLISKEKSWVWWLTTVILVIAENLK